MPTLILTWENSNPENAHLHFYKMFEAACDHTDSVLHDKPPSGKCKHSSLREKPLSGKCKHSCLPENRTPIATKAAKTTTGAHRPETPPKTNFFEQLKLMHKTSAPGVDKSGQVKSSSGSGSSSRSDSGSGSGSSSGQD